MVVALLLMLSLISTPIATPVVTLAEPDVTVVLPADAVTRPFLHDGRVYLGLDARQLVAIDLATGETLWTLPMMAALSDLPQMMDDTLLIPGTDGALYLVDATSGQLMDTVVLGTSALWTPVVTDTSIVVVSYDGMAYVLNRDDPHQVQAHVLGTSVGTRRVVMDNLLIAVVDGNVITAVDLTTLEIAWQSVAVGGVIRLFVTPEDRLIVGHDDGLLAMLDRDGAVRWQMVLQSTRIVDLTSFDGNVVLAQDDGFLASLNVETGDVGWQTVVEGNVRFSTDDCSGTCFVTMSNGTLGTLDAASGAVTVAYVMPSDPAARPTADDSMLVIPMTNGLLLIWHIAA